MSIQAVDDALRYFQKLQHLLDVMSASDLDESFMLASNEGRLCFVNAVLDAVLSRQDDMSDAVALGGLRAVVDPSATMLPYSVFAEDVTSERRMSVLSKIGRVFSEVFIVRCEPMLVHQAQSSSPWNSLCFMWWEILPRHGIPAVTHLRAVDDFLLDLMGSALRLDHLACKESALHGLALWRASRPEDVQELLDTHKLLIPDVLRKYSEAAKVGALQ